MCLGQSAACPSLESIRRHWGTRCFAPGTQELELTEASQGFISRRSFSLPASPAFPGQIVGKLRMGQQLVAGVVEAAELLLADHAVNRAMPAPDRECQSRQVSTPDRISSRVKFFLNDLLEWTVRGMK